MEFEEILSHNLRNTSSSVYNKKEERIILETGDKIDGLITMLYEYGWSNEIHIETNKWKYILPFKDGEFLNPNILRNYISTKMQCASLSRCIRKNKENTKQLLEAQARAAEWWGI